jgi:pyruvyltransferase
VIYLDWVNRGLVATNFGDAIAPWIVTSLSKRRVLSARDHVVPPQAPVYSTIGSMLASVTSRKWIVWGSGFIDTDSRLKARPAAVCAVRGPLSFQKLREQGVATPEVFGDPALLLARLYTPTRSDSSPLGVIPHFKDRDLPVVDQLRNDPRVRVIDIIGDPHRIMDEIASCEHVVSSSLHGLVAADAFGIPSRWIQLSDRPAGDGFKFHDYLAGVGRFHEDPLPPTPDAGRLIESVGEGAPLDWDAEAFLASCPFMDTND